MRRVAILVVCALVGLAAGAIWTLLQSDEFRADSRVLVRPASSRVVPAVEALAESSLVGTNVAQTLHLSSPPDISARRGDGGVLTVSAEAGSRERARQVDAEAVVVLTQKVAQRFGAAGVSATVLDPAHVAEQTSPTPGRNLLIAGVAGLIAGVAVAAALASRSRVVRVDPELEQRLQARGARVTQRELALARRAGQLAAREHDLGRREEEELAAGRRRAEELAQRQRELEGREAELETRAAELETREAEPEPEPDPEPEPRLEPQPAVTRTGWDLRTLERLVAERRGADPAQREEWNAYLFYLREHADHDGKLPATFDWLVAQVFGDVTGVFSPSDEL